MGLYSWSLLIGALNGGALALLILAGRGRAAPRILLATLLVLVSLRLAPFILGYAGAYDAHPGLTFAPFDLSFAYGPLLWAYVISLTTGRRPARLASHLGPAGLQLGYQLVCFALPLDAKWAWYTGGHLTWIAPAGAAIAILSGLAYLLLGWRAVARYRDWLDRTHANHEEARLIWLRAMLAAFAVVLGLAAAFALTSWFVRPLDYFARFPLMIGFAALIYVLGLLGWRHAAVDYPHPSGQAEHDPGPRLDDAPAEGRDYQGQGRAWRETLKAGDLWRDETLDLATLARHVGASPRTVSRTLGEGLGQTFREFLGRIRTEAAAEALANGDDDVLTIAFDVGFNSKASFNRAFQRYLGMTPSAWRRAARRRESRQSTPEAETEAMRRSI